MADCPQVDFDKATCSNTATYTINNYDNVGNVTWTVEGGNIVSVGGQPTYAFAGQYISNEYWNTPNIKVKSIGYNRRQKGTMWYWNDTYQMWDYDERDEEFAIGIAPNIAKNITVEWDPNASYKSVKLEAGGLGLFGNCGSSTREYQINIPAPFPAWSITPSKTSLSCSEGITISGAPSGYNYSWSIDGAVISNNWGTGVYVSRFTKNGPITATCTIWNECRSSSRTVILNVSQPDYGNIQQNGVDVLHVQPDCQGNFYLSMPNWVSNYTRYKWILPTGYDALTNVYSTEIKEGINLRNVQGNFPRYGYTDYIGKVIITGDCGNPIEKTFIIRPSLVPTVDAEFFSCTNQIQVTINNPNPAGNINPWVYGANPYNAYGTWSNITSTSATFTASGAGAFQVRIGLNDSKGCYTQLETVLRAGTAAITGNTNAGWQSGVLSDNRVFPGSNVIPYGQQLYFLGRDGKMYYYSFSTANQKWVINTVAGVTNAEIPVNGKFAKISVYKEGGVDYLIYRDVVNKWLYKLNLNSLVSSVVSPSPVTDFISFDNKIYYVKNGGGLFLYTNGFENNIQSSITPTLKLSVNNDYVYNLNNDLYLNGVAIISSGDILPTSDVFIYNGYLYYVRGSQAQGNLYRYSLTTFTAEQITTSNNLSGKFTINPASGVVYYGVQNDPNVNTINSPNGIFNSANIFQAYMNAGAWNFVKATNGSFEGGDMLIHSPVFSNGHLYYVGAGKSQLVNVNMGHRGLEVWNLYFEANCAPNIMRQITLDEPQDSPQVKVLPNPATDYIATSISNYDGSEYTIKVIDVKGVLVKEIKVSEESYYMSISDLSSGLYTVIVLSNTFSHTEKIIVE
ncbi:MAG: T9SS type A sorting domain-containing protein [Cytophagaceae bacterium]